MENLWRPATGLRIAIVIQGCKGVRLVRERLFAIVTLTRICASLGLRMKFKTLFDEEKHGHHFYLPLFFNIFMQFLAPGGLVLSVLASCKPEASRAGSEAPRPEKLNIF